MNGNAITPGGHMKAPAIVGFGQLDLKEQGLLQPQAQDLDRLALQHFAAVRVFQIQRQLSSAVLDGDEQSAFHENKIAKRPRARGNHSPA